MAATRQPPPDYDAVVKTGATFLDAVNVMRAHLDSTPQAMPLLKPQILVDAHFYVSSIEQDLPGLILALEEDETPLATNRAWSLMEHHIWLFSAALSGLSLNLLDIYQPGLGSGLASAYGWDSVVYGYFARDSYETNAACASLAADPLRADPPADLLGLANRFSELHRDIYFHWAHPRNAITKNECLGALKSLQNNLCQCQAGLAELIRLVAPLGAPDGREVLVVYAQDFIVGSKYSSIITGSTVGAFAQGDHAVATGHVTVHQGPLTQAQHREHIKAAKKALADDEDRLDAASHTVLEQFLKDAREVPVESREIGEVQAEIEGILERVWSEHGGKALPQGLQVIEALSKSPAMVGVTKKLLGE